MSNSDNPRKGSEFQTQVKEWFENKYQSKFEEEKKLPIGIGEEKKLHKFDVVDENIKIAIECKRYTWTKTGNVPSAKMGFCNEAAFYLHLLDNSYDKYIVMLYAVHPKRSETLAEYYYRTNKHLLGKTRIAEFNPNTKTMRVL